DSTLHLHTRPTVVFSQTLPRPPRSPLFPYTTLFRSPGRTSAPARCSLLPHRWRHRSRCAAPVRQRPDATPTCHLFERCDLLHPVMRVSILGKAKPKGHHRDITKRFLYRSTPVGRAVCSITDAVGE